MRPNGYGGVETSTLMDRLRHPVLQVLRQSIPNCNHRVLTDHSVQFPGRHQGARWQIIASKLSGFCRENSVEQRVATRDTRVLMGRRIMM